MDGTAILVAGLTVLGSVGGGVLGVFGGRRLSRSQAGSYDAQSVKTLAEADDLKLNTAIRAADALHNVSVAYGLLERESSRTRRQLDLMSDYAREHRRWDQSVLMLLEQMRGALKTAGLAEDLPNPGQPPPLAPEPADPDDDHHP